ncbi:dihydrolipoamide acetyltransferase family protein [Marinomonas spartinae]|uniref:dihydrolipoamide acetyltransferase family protein n=1 Tax=Marinomonas spartinae TaxID=1792290 RepID=UPI0018F203B1|nr:dihydrolipoamide acetyltransferase family protein [Marinomonas spartinae]MBJ7556007.1 2-oxo acid dehydrogenase subunit E2 [Marinomonas spartinae]
MNQSIEITLPNNTLEGTIATLSTWLVKEGEHVIKGAPILELETDKVAMEVCAEQDGVIDKMLVSPGEEVGEKTIFGYLESDLTQDQKQKSSESIGSELETSEQYSAESERSNRDHSQDAATPKLKGRVRGKENRRHLIGPAVRKLLRKHNLNIEQIAGTGMGGRVTRNDILAFINEKPAMGSDDSDSPISSGNNSEAKSQMIPHTPMRKAIANHMVDSLLRTSPHVTSVFEMDMGAVIEHRKLCKMGFDEAGVKLTFTAYFVMAAAQAIQKVPVINSRFHEESLEVLEDINIGVGTALGDDGLVVPVIKQVQMKKLFEVATLLQQQTERARQGKLTPADMKGGTFTISNHGVSGSLLATPIIINQPQVAILGIGKLEKRVVVEEIDGQDTMVIRPKCYVSLSIDHRALDAYQANAFLSHFVETIEQWGK